MWVNFKFLMIMMANKAAPKILPVWTGFFHNKMSQVLLVQAGADIVNILFDYFFFFVDGF
jgi:hypothetical protein